jgi:IclR family KDG regulon transcriptional repressor
MRNRDSERSEECRFYFEKALGERIDSRPGLWYTRSRQRNVISLSETPRLGNADLDKRYHLETLQATLRLIDLFLASSEHTLGVSEISRKLDLTKSQVYRILQNLVEYGYIQKDSETRKYQLGLKFLFAGQVVSRRLNLLQEANPVLDELCEQTDETVHFALITDYGPVCIAERQSSHRLRFFASVGMRLPWHAGSASKLLLAYLPPDQQEEILSRDSLEAYTPNTITDPDRLREELETIRCDGYATSNAEMSIGARAAAAPVRDHTGNVIAAISVVGPPERLDAGRMAEVAPLVIDAARKISTRLGFIERTEATASRE